MDKEVLRTFKQVHYKLHAFKDNQYATDPEDVITGEMVIKHLIDDNGHMLRNITMYPDWAGGAVVGLDADLIFKGKRFPVRFITQNPKKKNNKDKRYLSEYAKLAQQGHTITWVLYRKAGETKFVGRIQDGVYYRNDQQKAITIDEKKWPDTMKDYVALLTKELPQVPQEHVEGLVQTAGKLGMLK